MAKAKAPVWLREAFSRGVDAYESGAPERVRIHRPPAYQGANGYCWLAQFDPAERPCTPGRLERFHFIRRQDVEGAMWTQLRGATVACPECGGCGEIPGAFDDDTSGGLMLCPECGGWSEPPLPDDDRDALILIAAWDPRNGGLSCEQHHRRYDDHQVSLPRERVIVPYSAIPARVKHFGFDYSEGRLLDRFPSEI